ncbi:MAG: chorismate mutase [Syntrophobacteraceae bacterium]
MDDNLLRIREEIDSIDSDLLQLLNRRMDLAAEVGRIKASQGLPLFHPEREEIIFQRLSRLNPGPLTEESLRSIYREIFSASRLLQYILWVAFPGPEWTYSPNCKGKDAQEAGLAAGKTKYATEAETIGVGKDVLSTHENIEGEIAVGFRLGICGCLVEGTPSEFTACLNYPEVDLVEWRIDRFAGNLPDEELNSLFALLSKERRHPVIATNRPVREMGEFAGPEELRLQMLMKAAEAGAEWIDIEHDAGVENLGEFRRHGGKVLVSWHNPVETPDKQILHARLESMCKTGADALKIVTLAQSDEDNLRVLELVPLARKEFGIDLVAFCMGPSGKWSRVASLFLGSPWTYAYLPGRSTAAPGQFSISEMQDILRIMGRS